VVEYIVAIDVTRVRFPADAFFFCLKEKEKTRTILFFRFGDSSAFVSFKFIVLITLGIVRLSPHCFCYDMQ